MQKQLVLTQDSSTIGITKNFSLNEEKGHWIIKSHDLNLKCLIEKFLERDDTRIFFLRWIFPKRILIDVYILPEAPSDYFFIGKGLPSINKGKIEIVGNGRLNPRFESPPFSLRLLLGGKY